MPYETLYTEEEYLARERKAEYRSEFIDGRIVSMVGSSRWHNRIVFNLVAMLHTQLKRRPCEAYANDMRVKVSHSGLYTYPDVAALCGEPHFADEQVDTLLNPSVVFEVLSGSTETYDRGEKFARYRKLESLREYVLVAQDRPRVERYVREGESWVLTELEGLDAALSLPSIECVLPLREIYDRVEFP